MRSRQGTRPLDLAAARVGDDDAGEDLDRGGLAGAVGADIADQFTGFQGEGDAVQGPDGAVRALHDAPEGSPEAGAALGDAVGFYQVFNDDLGHDEK